MAVKHSKIEASNNICAKCFFFFFVETFVVNFLNFPAKLSKLASVEVAFAESKVSLQ